MLRYEELPYRYYIYDDFSPLDKLYPGDPVEVGYHGNMYQIILNSICTIASHAFIDSPALINAVRYQLVIQELKGGDYVTIGEGTFNGDAYLSSLELICQIKSAIIRLNVKPTDYYK